MTRLLLLAPTCDGEDVGEAWSTFQWVRSMAERHDVTVLTYHKRDRTPTAAQLPGVRVIEWPDLPVAGRFERLNSTLKPGYLAYYVRARRWIKRALARGESWDLAHQVAPLALRYPTPVQGLGLPYVLGPLGGSLGDPPGFGADAAKSRWYLRLRGLDGWRIAHDPHLARSYDGAACVVVVAPYVEDLLAPRHVRHFEWMSETGVVELPPAVERPPRRGPLQLLFVGRIIRTKGVRDAIKALDHLRDLDVQLTIAGDGDDRAACEAVAGELGLQDRVRFLGRVPRAEVDELYRDADIFFFPSYREPSGNVVFEAMSHGLPLVVCDRGGPGFAVDDSCGIKVPATDPASFAAGLATATRTLARDPVRRERMGAAARARVAELALWDRKVDKMDAIYTQVVASAAIGAPKQS